jgi:hypothetical protein
MSILGLESLEKKLAGDFKKNIFTFIDSYSTEYNPSLLK